jgi:hypothetical protein
LLVCAEDCADVEEKLGYSGCAVIRAHNSSAAMLIARHEQVDAAILVSTGKEMDVTETALNLSDINRSLEIIILADPGGAANIPIELQAAGRAMTAARIVTAGELNRYLVSGHRRGRAHRP